MFITFEAGEGAGKTTAAYELWKRAQRWKENAILTREPGGPELSEKIRELIVGVGSEGMDIRTEVLLFAAARREHLVKTIIPALDEGRVVICDRFLDSSVVYQGGDKWSGGPRKVIEVNSYVTAEIEPDLTFLLDVDPEIALERIASNHRGTNRFDEKPLDYHKKIRETYQWLAERNPKRYVVIDASQEEAKVSDDIWRMYRLRKDRMAHVQQN